MPERIVFLYLQSLYEKCASDTVTEMVKNTFIQIDTLKVS